MTLEEAAAFARDEVAPALHRALAARGSRPQEPGVSAAHPAGLSGREVDVLRLLADGLTDVQIAQRLIISPHTVNTHLKTIYRKLRVTSRSAATRVAIDQHLI